MQHLLAVFALFACGRAMFAPFASVCMRHLACLLAYVHLRNSMQPFPGPIPVLTYGPLAGNLLPICPHHLFAKHCPPIHPRICPPDLSSRFVLAIVFSQCPPDCPHNCPPDLSSRFVLTIYLLSDVLTIVLPIRPRHLFAKRSPFCRKSSLLDFYSCKSIL